MVKKYNIRPTRLLHDFNKKKPYIIFRGKKIYLKSSNKKLVKYILNKYFLKTKKKSPRKQAAQNIKKFLENGIKSEIYGISSGVTKPKINSEKPINIIIEDFNRKVTPKQFKKILPELEKNNNIIEAYKPDINVDRGGKITFDFNRQGLGIITFDSLDILQENAPLLLDKYTEKINKKIHNLNMENKREILHERILNKIDRRKYIKKDLQNQINANEANIQQLMKNNLTNFKEPFQKKFFNLKNNAGKKLLKHKIEEWNLLPVEDQYNYYYQKMKSLKRDKNEKFKNNEYKEGIIKKDLLELEQLKNIYTNNKLLEDKILHHTNKQNKFKNLNTGEIENITDTLTENQHKRAKSDIILTNKQIEKINKQPIFNLNDRDLDNLITPDQPENKQLIFSQINKEKMKNHPIFNLDDINNDDLNLITPTPQIIENNIKKQLEELKKYDIRGEEFKEFNEVNNSQEIKKKQRLNNYNDDDDDDDDDELTSNDFNISSLSGQQSNGKINNINGGLWNYQIDKIMKPFKFYIKTIPLNLLNNIIKYIEDKNYKKFGFIMNTETSDSKIRGHWIAIYCDLINDYTCEIYDPLAEKRTHLYKILEKKFSELFNRIEIPFYIKFKKNKIKQQSINTSTCGWFCIRFMLMRIQNISYKKATGYKGIEENETNIKCLKNSYNKFGYI